MTFKTKILSRLLIILLIQILVAGGFSLISLKNQFDRTGEASLLSAASRIRHNYEAFKHNLYLGIHFVSSLLVDAERDATSQDSIDRILRRYFSSIQVDRLIVVDDSDSNGDNDTIPQTLFDISADASGPTAELAATDWIALFEDIDFRFPQMHILKHTGSDSRILLSIVMGTELRTVSAAGEVRLLRAFLIKKVDAGFLQILNMEGSVRTAFFAGNLCVISDLPWFPMPEGALTGIVPCEILRQPYIATSQLLSIEIPENIHLVILQSALRDRIDLNRVVIIFIAAFFLTMGLSFLFGTGLTGPVIRPLTRFRFWLSTYMTKGEITPLDINTKDEIGYITRSFHEMVQKIIREEQIIRDQLDRITFLNRYTQSVVTHIQAGILILGENGAIEYANPHFRELIGAPDDGSALPDFGAVVRDRFRWPKDAPPPSPVSLTSETQVGDIRIPNRDGDERRFVAKFLPLSTDSEKRKCLLVFEDVTSQENIWRERITTEKISALGLLSAGMAHEINNPLGTILSHVNYLCAVETDREKLDSLQWIEKETKRIAGIIAKVLAFSRKEDDLKSDAVSVLKETVALLRFDLKRNSVQVTESYPENAVRVKVGSDELKQIYLNILLNARQALDGRGSIRVRALARRTMLEVIVRDDGAGIRPEHLPHIFDPFFTTKTRGTGTGLGLFVSYGILRRAGGDILVESRPGRGTTVTLRIPRLDRGKGEGKEDHP